MSTAEDEAVFLPLGQGAIGVGRGEHHRDHVTGSRLVFDRGPIGLLFAELLELVIDQVVRHDRVATHDRQAVQRLEREFGAHFAVQLELERLAGFGLEIMHVRLRGELQPGAVDGLAERVVHRELNRFLAHLSGVALAHHRGGGLAGAEARNASLRRVLARRFFFVGRDGVSRHRDLHTARDSRALGRSNGDGHAAQSK